MNFNENRINENEFEYVGFWARVGASLIDVIILMLITVPIMLIIYGDSYLDSESLLQGPVDFFVSYVFPAVAVIIFWYTKQATPGKMAIGARLVDARTGNAPSIGQLVGRYFAYIISTLPLCLGYFWIAFDSRKQAWHDKLAGTVVIRQKKRQRNNTELNRHIRGHD